MPTPSTAPAPSKPGTATPHTPQAPAGAGTATAPARSVAEVKTELLPRINRINQLEKDPQVARNMLPLISKETGVSVKVLEEQRRLYPVGGGGMLVCNEMAKATHKPASTFLKQRLQNRSWEQIAADNKFDLATVLPKLQRVEESILAARKQPKK